MAIAFDAATGKTDTASPVSWSHTTTASADRLMVITIQGPTSDTVTGVTYNGVAATRLLLYTGSTGQYHYVYGLIAPDSGAHNVEVSHSGTLQHWAQSATYTGVNQVALPTIFGGATNPGTATSLTLTLTSVVDNSWMVMGSGVQRAPTASTGSTQRTNSGGDNSGKLFDSNGAITPAGNKSMAVTFSSIAANGMASSGVIIEPPATTLIKTVDGLEKASVKTVNGLAIASVKTINGLA